jgi:hypothetical protein
LLLKDTWGSLGFSRRKLGCFRGTLSTFQRFASGKQVISGPITGTNLGMLLEDATQPELMQASTPAKRRFDWI